MATHKQYEKDYAEHRKRVDIVTNSVTKTLANNMSQHLDTIFAQEPSIKIQDVQKAIQGLKAGYNTSTVTNYSPPVATCDHQDATITMRDDGYWDISFEDEQRTIICTLDAISGVVDRYNELRSRMEDVKTMLIDYGHRPHNVDSCWACGEAWPCRTIKLVS